MILGVLSPFIHPHQVIHYKAQLPNLAFAAQWQTWAMLLTGVIIIYFLLTITRLKRKNQELEAFNFDLNRELVEKALIEKILRDKTLEMEDNLSKNQKEEKES
jgi:hypothetical protein